MPPFAYTAIDKHGERKVGVLNAERADDVVKKLQQEYTTIVNIHPVKKSDPNEKQSFSQLVVRAVKRVKDHVPTQNVVFFTRQLATMFAAGMTIEKSLSNLTKYEKNLKFKNIINKMAKDIRSGKTFSDTLAQHPGAFSSLYTALIRAGEISGTLGEILNRLADYLERTEDVKRKVMSSLYYPICVLGILAMSIYLLVVVVAPKFNSVYESFGAELPIPTQVLMNVSGYLIDNFILGILFLIAVPVCLSLFAMTDKGRFLFDYLKIHLPVMGTLMHDAVMARFSRTLGMLMNASIPVLDAFTLSSQVVNNVITEKAVTQARDLIQDGRSINRALAAVNQFPDILIQLVNTGEETGEIGALLLKCAEFYEKQVDSMVNKITSLIEPLLIVLLGLVVGTLVIIIYLPIFYLGSAVKHGG